MYRIYFSLPWSQYNFDKVRVVSNVRQLERLQCAGVKLGYEVSFTKLK